LAKLPPFAERNSCDLSRELVLHSAGVTPVCGVDEVGRGCIAGPVYAAAVILPPTFQHPTLTDSKKLTPSRREKIYQDLVNDRTVIWSVASVDVDVIDSINILRASHEAMRQAVAGLKIQPVHALIDGLPVHPFPIQQTALVKGDSLSLSIAAASVLAKVTRDRWMVKMDKEYPGYEFALHKGYATKAHLAKLRANGASPIHRRTFAPVAQVPFPW